MGKQRAYPKLEGPPLIGYYATKLAGRFIVGLGWVVGSPLGAPHRFWPEEKRLLRPGKKTGGCEEVALAAAKRLLFTGSQTLDGCRS